MGKQTITFTRVFAAAHRLYPYEGKCANIHGHNYKAVVEIDAPVKSATGFIIEFDTVKAVIDELDHSLILSRSDPLLEVLDAQVAAHLSIVVVNFQPTTENLAMFLAQGIKDATDRETAKSTPATSAEEYGASVEVTLWETDSICARAIYPWD